MTEQHAMVTNAVTAALVSLAEHGISPDVQELLVGGDGRGRVAPHALHKAIRAALTALLEPTPDMVEAGQVPTTVGKWRAMIQHVLTDSDGSPEGRDAQAARSRSDESAGREASAQAQRTTPATTKGER